MEQYWDRLENDWFANRMSFESSLRLIRWRSSTYGVDKPHVVRSSALKREIDVYDVYSSVSRLSAKKPYNVRSVNAMWSSYDQKISSIVHFVRQFDRFFVTSFGKLQSHPFDSRKWPNQLAQYFNYCVLSDWNLLDYCSSHYFNAIFYDIGTNSINYHRRKWFHSISNRESFP